MSQGLTSSLALWHPEFISTTGTANILPLGQHTQSFNCPTTPACLLSLLLTGSPGERKTPSWLFKPCPSWRINMHNYPKCWSILIFKAHKVKTVEFTNSVAPDEVAQHRLLHLDLQCLMSSLWIAWMKHSFVFVLFFADVNFAACFAGNSFD